MGFLTGFAIYFVIWWVVLFLMLPFGVRTQDDADDVTLGTTSSAPSGPHMARVIIRTTLGSLVIYGVFYLLTSTLGYRFEDIPSIIPRFD